MTWDDEVAILRAQAPTISALGLKETPDDPSDTRDMFEELEADLLAIEESGNDWLASVRYTGTIREAQGAPATPFQEIWNLAKRKDGSSGWLLAGMQQIQ